MSCIAPFHLNLRKRAPKSLCSDFIAPTNRYGFALTLADEVQYNAMLPPTEKKSCFRHDPYAQNRQRVVLAAVNLAFERAAMTNQDLSALFEHINSSIIPQHAEGQLGACPATKYFVKYAGLDRSDATFDVNGFPCKERRFVVETNYPFLSELLHDSRLYILSDRLCFHVCWDGKKVVRGEGDDMQGYVHDVKGLRERCDAIRSMGLRARHRTTDGLPCTAVRFDCFYVTQL